MVLAPALMRAHAEDTDRLNEVVGANQTLEQGFGARQSGMAIAFPSFQRSADAVANAPAGMNDVDDFTFATAHTEKFGEAKYDDFAFLFPIESGSSMGIGISRYGVSDIDFRPSGSEEFSSQPQGYFSIADYLVTGAFARRWGGLDLGLDLNLLYRHLDQDGLGIRGDAQVLYTWEKRFRLGALLKGLVPSSARWESGYSEYEAPELYIGGAARFPAPYFYGTLEAAWQSEGIFHRTAKSAATLDGSSIAKDPLAYLATGNLGLEFLFDFGVAIRFGLEEISRKAFADVTTFGIGYDWRHVLGLDYSFSPHPGLQSSHRISIQFTPSFPRFNGRDFRNRASRSIRPARTGSGSPSQSGSAGPKPEAEKASTPSAVQPADTAPTGSPRTPEAVEPPNPPPPAAPPVQREILETDD